MPTYEYECQKCKDRFEIEQKITVDKLTKCSKCKGKLERILSAPGFSLKGGGWYKDGYSKTDAKKPAATATSAAPVKEAPKVEATAPKANKESA